MCGFASTLIASAKGPDTTSAHAAPFCIAGTNVARLCVCDLRAEGGRAQGAEACSRPRFGRQTRPAASRRARHASHHSRVHRTLQGDGHWTNVSSDYPQAADPAAAAVAAALPQEAPMTNTPRAAHLLLPPSHPRPRLSQRRLPLPAKPSRLYMLSCAAPASSTRASDAKRARAHHPHFP